MTNSSVLEWLCRTENNEIIGPLSIEEVRSRIIEKKLGPQDEVCQSGAYWFAVHEVEEVRAFLGIDPPIEARVVPDGATLAITKTNLKALEAQQKPNVIPVVSESVVTRTPRVPVQPARGPGGVFWVKWAAFILGFCLILVIARVYIMARS